MSNADGPQELIAIRVRVLDREYPLRVAPGDEDYTLHLAHHVDERMQALRRSLPTQPDLTHAVLAALELAEEMFAARAARDQYEAHVELEANDMVERLTQALSPASRATP